MPKSRKRGGDKAHRARVKVRNTKLRTEQTRFNQLLRENMMKQIEQMKETQSEENQTEKFELGNIKKEEQDIY